MVCSNPRCSKSESESSDRCSSCGALLIGTRVRAYKIVKMVGKGGFGVTYLVEDEDCFSAKRILKELSPMSVNAKQEKSTEINEIAERLFHREAQVLLKLSHPGIPKLYAYFNEGGYSYLVQDYIPGKTLSEELSERKQVFSEREVCQLMLELAEILEYLHSQKPPIIHRDIKPQNLMRHSDGRLQLIDFGAVYRAASGQVSSETLIGSPGYAPPEQLLGEVRPESDLYAAGATMLRLLTGIHPSKLFSSTAKGQGWESKVRLSPDIIQLLRELLASNPSRRLRSAGEFKHRLQQLLAAKTEVGISGSLTERSIRTGDVAADIESRLDNSQAELAAASKPPEEEGSLDKVPFPYLLARICREKISCRLTCTLGIVSKTIYFDQGMIVFARSNQKEDRLGETMMRLGKLSKADFDRASQEMRLRKVRFGRALVELGVISREDLRLLIADQVSLIVYSLFEWGGGGYEITKEEPRKRSISISLSCAELVFEGLRRMKNMDLVKQWLGDFSWKLAVTNDPLLLYQSLNLTPKEWFIVSRIENEMSLDEILSLGGLPEDETLKTVCGLIAVGVLRWVGREKVGQVASAEPISRMLRQSPPAKFDIQSAALFCYEVENMLACIKTPNHYAVLDVPRKATAEQINEAYDRLARKFHPDRHVQLSSEYNLSLRTDLEKIFARISEAYKVLSDPKRREEYDRSSKTLRLTAIPIKPDEPVNPEPVSLPRGAAAPGNEKSGADAASVWFDKGRRYYNAFQFRQACDAFQAAVKADPNCALYRMFLARSLVHLKEHMAMAKEHFCRAIELEPNNPDYLAEVGLFFQKLGSNKEANRMFERALQLVPDHPIARRAKTN
ncbi:MAG: protein kinase [Acidobacteriota bacterium]|nr:protein kinase [Blastocatellia bacterium]MDW8412682.1 protein kinase [Acidobacteriota bacterium]